MFDRVYQGEHENIWRLAGASSRKLRMNRKTDRWNNTTALSPEAYSNQASRLRWHLCTLSSGIFFFAG
jgi:hypothetical protein